MVTLVCEWRKNSSIYGDLVTLCCREDLIIKGPTSAASVWLESWTAMKAVVKVQTFQIIVLQGIVGSLPWTAMVFFTMWFELIGKHYRKFHTSMKQLLIIFSALLFVSELRIFKLLLS